MAVIDFVGKEASLGHTEAAAAPQLAARDKPYGVDNMSITIALSVSIPVVVILSVLAFLYRRNLKRQRLEDVKDPHRDLDFGLGDTPMSDGKKKSRKSFLLGGDKANHRTNQLSMDMNLSSPYLLPPQVQGSHDSLARDYSKEYDPYQIVNSEVGSIKSFGKDSRHTSGPIRQGSFPKSSLSSHEKSNPFASPAAPEPIHRSSTPNDPTGPIQPLKPQVAEIGNVNGDEPYKPLNIQQPPAAVAKNPMERVASPPMDDKFDFGLPPSGTTAAKSPAHSDGLGIDLSLPQPLSPIDDLMFTTANSSPQPDVNSPQPTQAARTQATTATPGERDSQGSFYDDQPQTQTADYYEDYSDYGRGRSAARQSVEHQVQPQPRQQPGSLGVPQQESKRLSVGFRPLPPDDALDSEDPEYRANRIRSFYKEYFDDSKEAAPPVPGVPAQHAAPNSGPSYYEDYDERYMGEAALFDPDSNAFVLPYAQPVHRRAMTPPPAGRRPMPGPPGPRGAPRSASRGPGPRPHGPHGSLGGMSLPGGPRSQSAWGPRPGSSASRKNLPPPAALKTLPTPSKLTDDSFALMNATDFAPPDAFGDRARGRSQSPLGERRPYQPKVPAVSPLVNSYDELNALPSPHLLRKSSTFTGLDFLPPKKFKDQDSNSDAGSIRSNRSGLSAQAAHAIRSGAGRISRLPGDQVFTQQALASELKPQWGMRQ